MRNEKCEYTKEFLRAVYLTSETEILANVQELYETIKRNEIASKQEFTKFIVNSPIYKEYKSLEKIEAMSFWKNIINEKTLDLLLTSFGINDIDKIKWFINKLETIKNQLSSALQRMYRLLDLVYKSKNIKQIPKPSL